MDLASTVKLVEMSAAARLSLETIGAARPFPSFRTPRQAGAGFLRPLDLTPGVMAMLGPPTPPPGPAPARPRILLVVLLVTAVLGLVADQAGKGWAFAPGREPAGLREIAPGVFAGAQGRNFGAMFSPDGADASASSRIVLTLVGFVATGMLLRGVVLDRDRWRAIHAVGGGMVLAGALGNQVDRLALGYVRDYLILRIYPQGIFNTADVFMALGGLLLVGTWAASRRPTLGFAAGPGRSPRPCIAGSGTSDG